MTVETYKVLSKFGYTLIGLYQQNVYILYYIHIRY